MPRSLPGAPIGLPSTKTSPAVGSSKPAMMRNRVDLPQPEAPIRQANAPLSIAASMRPSASISPSPTWKRLVTPRMTTWARLRLGMVLRTPSQHAVADHDDDAIGHESADADDDHTGHHQVGARERAAVHDHGAEPGGDAGHFADHDQDPGKSMRNAKPVEDRRQRRRKHDLTEHGGAGAAEHRSGLEQPHIDRAHAEDGVEQDRIERAEEYEKDRRVRPQSEKDHRQRQPYGDRDRPQKIDRRVEELPQDAEAADPHPGRAAHQRGQGEAPL